MGVPVYCIYSWIRIAYYLVLLMTGEAFLSLISMAFLTVSSTFRISYISLSISVLAKVILSAACLSLSLESSSCSSSSMRT